jgi:hypothetical protein
MTAGEALLWLGVASGVVIFIAAMAWTVLAFRRTGRGSLGAIRAMLVAVAVVAGGGMAGVVVSTSGFVQLVAAAVGVVAIVSALAAAKSLRIAEDGQR